MPHFAKVHILPLEKWEAGEDLFSPLGKGHSQLALTPLEKEARGDFINSPLYKRREGGGISYPPLYKPGI